MSPGGPPLCVAVDAVEMGEAARAGTANYVTELVEHLVRLDGAPELTLLLHRDRPAAAPVGARRVLLGGPRRSAWWLQVRLPLYFAAHRFDVVHAPSERLPAYRGAPTLVTVHDLAAYRFPDTFGPRQGAWTRWHLWRAARAATHLVAVSERTRQDLIEILHVSPELVTTVAHGVDTQRFHPRRDAAAESEVRRRHGLGAPYVLHVGSLQPRKNLGRLAAACAAAPAARHLDLVLCGQPGWRHEEVVASLRAAGLGARLRWLAYVPAGDLPHLYRAAAAFVLPSLYEGFGLPLLEAMACGVPAAAARAGSLPEVGGDAVRFFDPLDADDLGAALEAVLSDTDLRHESIRRGLERAAEFRWQTTAERTLELYAHLARRRPATRAASAVPGDADGGTARPT